ncbi:MAG: ATP-binding protein, partial [Gemmatimonadales bacterium]
MNRTKTGAAVGRVVATEQFPSSPHQFHFWTSRDTSIGIGTFVRVDGEQRTVFAAVISGRTYADLESPIDDVAVAAGDPTRKVSIAPEREITLWTAAVLRQEPPEPMQPVPLETVKLATAADVQVALRMESYTSDEIDRGIPVGTYSAGGMSAPVYLDSEFLLGPESAHLNISGVSGLATKTSAIQFLLSSIFQHFPDGRGGIAAVCFNVKGPDLCYLDQPADLSAADLAQYDALGIAPDPFEDVTYYAPLKADGVNLNTLRTHPELVDSVEPLIWGINEVLDYHEVLLNRDDLDAKADALIDFLTDRVINKEFADDWGGVHRVQSFAGLEKLFKAIFNGLEASARGDIWRTHHIATIRKVRNRLLNISTRCKGLVSDDGVVNDLPFGTFADRSVHVVDVAGADQLAQDLVFTRVVSKLTEHLERRDLGVDHVIV